VKNLLNQTFRYTRRTTPKRVTSLRHPSAHHSAEATQLQKLTNIC